MGVGAALCKAAVRGSGGTAGNVPGPGPRTGQALQQPGPDSLYQHSFLHVHVGVGRGGARTTFPKGVDRKQNYSRARQGGGQHEYPSLSLYFTFPFWGVVFVLGQFLKFLENFQKLEKSIILKLKLKTKRKEQCGGPSPGVRVYSVWLGHWTPKTFLGGFKVQLRPSSKRCSELAVGAVWCHEYGHLHP